MFRTLAHSVTRAHIYAGTLSLGLLLIGLKGLFS